MTTVATTLTTLASLGRAIWFMIHSGRVSTREAREDRHVHLVEAEGEGEDGAGDERAAELRQRHSTNVCHGLAPRSFDASSMPGFIRRSRASTLLNTMTMQKVPCAMIMP